MLRIIGACVAIVSLLFSAGVTRAANGNGNSSVSGPEVTTAGAVSESGPVRDTPPGLSAGGDKRDRPLHLIPPRGANGGNPDTAIQSSVSGPAVPTTSGFAGVGLGDYGFSPDAAPPDTNGAVGATQYVQWVNEQFAVFDKTTGAIATGFPKPGNTLWAGLKDSKGNPSGCAVNNDGDPVVQYDKAANRWVMTQFSVSSPGTYGYLQCVAVSKTSDATGAYYQYAFSEPNFNDYPKLGVWPDGYYLTFNMFGTNNAFLGGRSCALDRTKMLVGDPTAQQVCFQFSTNDGGLLPSDLDGSNPPPAGAPNYVVEFGTNSLELWKFHVNFATPNNSTLTGPTNIAVTNFSPACNGGGTCIPQSGTSQQLDSLADRLMYRLAYRNFGDHDTLVVNHSVTANTSVGVRWYELRNPGGTPTVYQQGTYAPDSKYRWMGSIAMDASGDIAMGYSVSSSSMFPSIAYTGRLVGDPVNTMEAENTIQVGGGSQQTNLNRWGDYSAMTVDPVDDCTFWYTNEYLKSSGTFNWSTSIASFKFPTCSSAAVPDFNLNAAPASQTVSSGTSASYTVNVSGTGGFKGTTALTASGLPSGATATFSPASVTGTGSSTMTITTSASTPNSSSTVTITGTSGAISHTTTVGLTVQTVPPNFALSASPTSVQEPRNGGNTTSTVTVTPSGGFKGTVALSVTGQPSGVTASFSPTSVTGSGSSTLRLTTNGAQQGTFTLTVTGISGSLSHTTPLTLKITKR